MPDRDLSGEARLRGEREVRRRSRGQTVQRVREQAQTRRKSTDLREKQSVNDCEYGAILNYFSSI